MSLTDFEFMRLTFLCPSLLPLLVSILFSSSNLHLPLLSLKQYHYQEDDSPLDQGFPRLTNEVRAPELVHVSEKNLSEIENVHGYVSHSHISPLKVRISTSFPLFANAVFHT